MPNRRNKLFFSPEMSVLPLFFWDLMVVHNPSHRAIIWFIRRACFHSFPSSIVPFSLTNLNRFTARHSSAGSHPYSAIPSGSSRTMGRKRSYLLPCAYAIIHIIFSFCLILLSSSKPFLQVNKSNGWAWESSRRTIWISLLSTYTGKYHNLPHLSLIIISVRFSPFQQH